MPQAMRSCGYGVSDGDAPGAQAVVRSLVCVWLRAPAGHPPPHDRSKPIDPPRPSVGFSAFVKVALMRSVVPPCPDHVRR